MAVIPPLSHEQLLFLVLQLFLVLLVARGLGEIARAVNLPAVLGELLAGIALGPSILGVIAPGLFVALFPQHPDQFHLLEVVAWVGLVMLLILTGLETDLRLISSRARPAVLISAGGIVIPFATGFGLGYVLPAKFLAAPDQRLVFSLFVAVAMSISAIPVIAKVLIDMDIIDREIGQITIAAGMIDDTVGWILLSLVAALAGASGGAALSTAAETVVMLILFLGISFTVGRRAVERIVRWVDVTFEGDEGIKITTLVVLALGAGAVTHYMGVEMVLGAFVVGVLVGQVRRFDRSARHTFEVVTLGVFAPVFFAIAGLRVDLTTLLDPNVFWAGMAVLGIAIVGKFLGASLGARAAGLSRWEGIALGAGMNARGAIELIVATIGLSLGILTIEMYSIIVMVAVITSLMAPPLLRASLQRVDMSEEESERLERAEAERHSFVENVVRVLLPTRCDSNSLFAAQLLGHLVRDRDIEVTNMFVQVGERSPPSRTASVVDRLRRTLVRRSPSTEVRSDGGPQSGGGATEADECLDLTVDQLRVGEHDVRKVRRTVETNFETAVVDEAERGYDVLVVGADEPSTDDQPFGSLVDDIVQTTPCPLVVVRERRASGERPPEPVPIRRILLPTVGTEYSRHAAEVAFAIARGSGALVEVLHVVNRPQVEDPYYRHTDVPRAVELGQSIVDRDAEIGRRMNVEVLTDVVVGDKPERDIVSRAVEDEVDLVVLGSELRPVTHRAFLGHRVEHVFRNAPCAVAVVVSL